MSYQPRSRQFVTFLLVLGAVVFGIVLAGGLDMTPGAMGGPAVPAYLANDAPGAAGPSLPGFADLAEAVDPAVVSILSATIEDPSERGQREVNPFDFFFGPRRGPGQEGSPQGPRRQDSGGSGFVVSSDGLVITNYHVIEGATSVRVVLNDREYTAEVRGQDPATDIALLQIDAGEDLTYLKLGDSDSVRVGEWVMAVGSPLRLAKSVTVGVVSAKGRSLGISGNDISFENFIQTDAAINFGNSGGPLINMRGEVIGINTAINYGAENIGFAVPSNTLSQILPQLRESGRVSRGYLGVQISPVDYAAAEAYGLDGPGGALVVQVIPGEPAGTAGIQPEDIILEVDGRKVQDTRDLIDYVSAQRPDSTVTLKVWRGRKMQNIDVKLSERGTAEAAAPQRNEAEEGSIDWLGINYQGLTPGLRDSHGLPSDLEGVWVTDVAPTSPLYEEGLRQGPVIQVITAVNGRPVTSVDEFESAVESATSGDRLRLYVRRFAQGEEAQPLLAFPAVP